MNKKIVILGLLIIVAFVGIFNVYSINDKVNDYLQDTFGIRGAFNGPDASETGNYGPPTPEEEHESQKAWEWHNILQKIAAYWWLIVVGILIIALWVVK